MKRLHMPPIDIRYWTAITLSSIFGTNLGDLYAHKSGLGLIQGVGVLSLLAALVFATERFENRRHQVYYWLIIIIIRTGATNIADYLAYIAKVPPVLLGLGVTVILCFFAWISSFTKRGTVSSLNTLPNTNIAYWIAMLAAGVFGTLGGDLCSDILGEGSSSLGLGAILLIVLFFGRQSTAKMPVVYWVTVAIARTAGTSMGDWLAENHTLYFGLSISTLITGVAFLSVLLFWKSESWRAEDTGSRIASPSK